MSLTQDRYELLHLVSEARVDGYPDVQLWRATDTALGRTVALTAWLAQDPRIPDVQRAVAELARVDARALVRLLDMFSDDEHTVVVTEWVNGSTLSDIYEQRDGEPLGVRRGLQIARALADALAVAHAQGVHHGHLRPASVLVTSTGDVRLRGVALDAAIWGHARGPVAADIHGIGSVLYATITSRWPAGLSGGLAAAPRSVDGHVLLPSQVTAEVPSAIDKVVARCLADSVPVRGAPAFTSAAEVATALGVAESTLRAPASSSAPRRVVPARSAADRRRTAARAGLAAGIVATAGVLTWAGTALVTAAPSPWGVADAPDRDVIFASTASAGPTSGLAPAEIEPTRLKILGPEGVLSDDELDPDTGPAAGLGGLPEDAVDDSEATAWLTPTYFSAAMDGTPGIGLVLDLGSPQAVNAVDLSLIGSPTSVDVRLAPELWPNPERWTPFASAATVGQQITVRAPRPVIGRYVLVWISSVPRSADGYQGGIAEVRVT